jgi:deazaflavin-dependent oxidoreductase (nitroreductase family)
MSTQQLEPTPAPTRAAGRGKPRIPALVPIFNPIARRLMQLGAPLGPNALLSVQGRKTGQLRTTPVAVVNVDGRRWVIGTFGEVGWVRNLRAAGEGVLTIGRRKQSVGAVELSRGEAESFFAEVLGPYVRRVPLGRWLLSSVLRAPDILEDPHRAAELHPVFELHTSTR